MSGKKYSNAQKLAYYKKLVAGRGAYRYKGRGAYRSRPLTKAYTRPYVGRGAYRRRRYRGRGAYEGEDYGATGKRIGKNIGGGLGELAGEVVKFFAGRGGYEVKNNSLMVSNPDMPPIVNRPNKPGSVVIRKSEYIGDIISSSSANTFSNITYNINPGLMNTFEWLSQIAVNFEEYEFCGMYFEYRTMSADALNSTNTALGQVIMAVDYNAGNAAFTSKQQMENYEGAISVKPSESVRFFVECSPRLNPISELYVRGNAVPSDEDIRLYDLGVLNIATNGLQGTSVNCGELWVTYEVCLLKSKLYTSLGLGIPWATFTSNTWGNSTPLGGFTAPHSDSTLAVVVTSSTVLTFPETSLPQEYIVYIEWYGSGAVTVAFPTVTPANGTYSSNSSPTAGDTARGMSIIGYFSTYGNSVPTLTYGSATLPTSPSNGFIQVTQVSNNFNT